MKVGFSRVLAGCAAVVAGMVLSSVFASPAGAAATPVEIQIPVLRAIQPYNLDKEKSDQVYMLVTGVAKGEAFSKRLPEGKTLEAAKKILPLRGADPLSAWKGELADNEFALVSITLIQGKGEDAAKIKEYQDKLDAALKKVEARSKKELASKGDATKLAEAVVAAEQEFITNIKDVLSREKNTDHYGGLFNIMVWNNGTKIMKRLDPVGLTFGEHYGIDPKVYTKIKKTLQNAYTLLNGEWGLERLGPLTEDEKSIRVKMLETELVGKSPDIVKSTTDYVAEVQVLAGGKPLTWSVEDEVPPPESQSPETHTYWQYGD